MSMPNIPDIDPCIHLSLNDTFKLVLTSSALHDLSMSHILNAEGEKIQKGLQMVKCLNDLYHLNLSLNKTLRNIVYNQILMQMKFTDAFDLYQK